MAPCPPARARCSNRASPFRAEAPRALLTKIRLRIRGEPLDNGPWLSLRSRFGFRRGGPFRQRPAYQFGEAPIACRRPEFLLPCRSHLRLLRGHGQEARGLLGVGR